MNRSTALLLVLSALVATGCSESGAESGSSSAATATRPAVTAGSMEDALALAKETDLPVLVEYMSETCPYCKQMERDTLSTPEVKRALQGVVHFRAVKGKNAEAFEEAWGTPPTPSFLVLSSDGSAMGSMRSGVIAKADFMNLLRWASSGQGSMPSFRTGGG
jgi:thiol:disulfide interchange protein